MKNGEKSTKKSSTNSKKTPAPKTSWSLLTWIDEHLFLLLSGFLLIFIPLYPKIPLADIIPGYIVRIRLEDFFIFLTGVLYLIQLVRKKVTLSTPLTLLVIFYAIVGCLSTLSAIFITHTVPSESLHIAKTLLHYVRYLEYFSLFFIAYSSIKSRRDIEIILAIFAITMMVIGFYGWGQKYYYWPVYSTMNREFSKGLRLYLTENARVQSTFGGHYDLAGYLVVSLPILFGFFFYLKNKTTKILIFPACLSGLWLLIVSASRASFISFMFSLLVLLFFFSLQQPTTKERLKWGITRFISLFIIISLMMVVYGGSINERFQQTLNAYPIYQRVYHDVNDIVKKAFKGEFQQLLSKFRLIDMPKAQPPKNGISTDELEQILVSSDEQPRSLPPDVKVDVPIPVVTVIIDASGTAISTIVAQPRDYSENAKRYGLSLAIRLDTLWPRAIAGFYANPLLGSGYATLTKENVIEFTEAESTDNNFLRTLGETGLLGFVTFYSLFLINLAFSMKVLLSKTPPFTKALAISFIASTIGILLNAVYIDVFASSKVAFTYWGVAGFILAHFTQELHLETKKVFSFRYLKSVLNAK